MRFTQAFVAALSAAVAQAVIITNADFSNIAAGGSFPITFSGAVGQVTVFLATGTPQNVIQGPAIGSAAGPSGSIPWTPKSGGSFALKIIDDGAPESEVNPNFSGFFTVAGDVASTSTTAAGQTSTTTHNTSPLTALTTTTASIPVGNVTTTTLFTATSRPHGNETTHTSATRTNTKTSTSTDGSSGNPTDVISSMAAGFSSPLAFVLLAVGALLTLN